MQITALFYKPKVKVSTPIVPLQKFVYRDKILYASDKDNRYLYTEEEMKNLPKKLLPDDNYISDNKGNHYIYIDRDDSRLQWGDSYLYIRVNNTKSFSKKDLKKDDKKYNSY